MKKNRLNILVAFVLTVFFLTSCSEVNSTDPKETYRHWAGTNPPADLELINGQYWQSAHWTKEYIMYLKFKPTEEWWTEFLKQNYISADKVDWTMPNNAPTWFKPSENSIRFGGTSDFGQGSRCFKDTLTGVCYIYEIQL
jgi:hypothetical protein